MTLPQSIQAGEQAAQAWITQDVLRTLTHYDPATGIFTRLVSSGVNGIHKAGKQIGGFNDRNKSKYLITTLLGKKVYLHRLAFLYMQGAFPLNDVDHINGNESDNRWCNLRDVQTFVNVQNIRKPTRVNTSGFLGVSYDKERNKFEAAIRVGDRRIRRRFDTAEEAAVFYLETKRVVHIGCTI